MHAEEMSSSTSPKASRCLSQKGSDPLEAKRNLTLLCCLPGEGLTPFGIGFMPKWLTALIAMTIIAIGTTNMVNNIGDADLWGHIQYGREVIADRELPATASWTYAAPDAPWVNHENIAELWLATAYDGFGVWGLTLSKWLMSLAMIGLMVWGSRRLGASWLITGFVVYIVSDLLYLHWHFRPQALTYLGFVLLLAVWQGVFANWPAVLKNDATAISDFKKRMLWLWSLPFLMMFWANSHGGFAAGAVILVVYHTLRCLEMVWCLPSEHRRMVVHLGAISLVSVLATLVNPYGVGLWQFMWMALTLRRTEIGDFQPLPLGSPEALMVGVLTVFIVLGALADKRRRDWVQLLLMGLLLWQGLSHARHIVIFAILCGFWLPGLLQGLVEWLGKRIQSPWENFASSPLAQKRFATALIVLVLFCGWRTYPSLREITVDKTFFPVAALEFMDEHGLRKRTFASFNWGQYVLGYFATHDEGLIAIDGRYETCYPRSVIDRYFDFMFGPHDPKNRFRSPTSPPYDPAWALGHGEPELVLVERNSFGTEVLEANVNEWVLLYRDSVAQLWGRRTLFDDPTSKHFISPTQRRITDEPQLGHARWPAFPNSSGSDRAEKLRLVEFR
jgi:hypothetical protein